jgi:hypothetical protein
MQAHRKDSRVDWLDPGLGWNCRRQPRQVRTRLAVPTLKPAGASITSVANTTGGFDAMDVV